MGRASRRERPSRLRVAAAAILYAGLVWSTTACGDSFTPCFEGNANAYAIAAPGDSTATFRWPGAFHPVRFYAEPTAELPANVDSGLVLWMSAFRCSELSVVRVTDSTLADVIIRNPALMPPPAAGVALFADSVGACQGRTDVKLDSLDRVERPIRSFVSPNIIDAVAVGACYHFVVAHEIGHTLGLFAHSTDPADLMYAVPRRRALSLDDRYTIQLLYHLPQVGLLPVPR